MIYSTFCSSQSFFLLIVFSNWCGTLSITHGLFSLSIPLYSNRFQSSCSLRPFSLAITFIQQSISYAETRKMGSASKRMTKSWYILQKSILFLCCRGHHSTFSFHHFIIWDFYLIIYLGQKMKVRFSYNILISLYAQCLIHKLTIHTLVCHIPNV